MGAVSPQWYFKAWAAMHLAALVAPPLLLWALAARGRCRLWHGGALVATLAIGLALLRASLGAGPFGSLELVARRSAITLLAAASLSAFCATLSLWPRRLGRRSRQGA